MHDSELYPDPFTFLPDRFVQVPVDDAGDQFFSVYGKSQPDPRTFAFGFGRRTCPGKHRFSQPCSLAHNPPQGFILRKLPQC